MARLLYDWDVFFFRFVNEGWSSGVLDVFFSFVTKPKNWLVPIVVAVIWLLTKGGVKGRITVAALVLSVAVSDPVTVRILKPAVQRVRPCNVLMDVQTPAGGSGAWSFPSAHAANIASTMTVLSLAYPLATPYCAAVALLVGTSRVYLGLHYPSDILGGYLLGMIIGIFFWHRSEEFRVRWVNRHPPRMAGSHGKGRK